MTNNDRELLELAAKASGVRVVWTDNYGGAFLTDNGCPVFWRPLTDDGDALRLAVALRLSPDHTWADGSVLIEHGSGDSLVQVIEEYGCDASAATRRVIVRAAAEIGRSI